MVLAQPRGILYTRLTCGAGAGQVGDDAELALDEHELAAVMHLVLLEKRLTVYSVNHGDTEEDGGTEIGFFSEGSERGGENVGSKHKAPDAFFEHSHVEVD